MHCNFELPSAFSPVFVSLMHELHKQWTKFGGHTFRKLHVYEHQILGKNEIYFPCTDSPSWKFSTNTYGSEEGLFTEYVDLILKISAWCSSCSILMVWWYCPLKFRNYPTSWWRWSTVLSSVPLKFFDSHQRLRSRICKIGTVINNFYQKIMTVNGHFLRYRVFFFLACTL